MGKSWRLSRIAAGGMCLVIFASVTYWIHSGKQSKVDNHRIQKRQSEEISSDPRPSKETALDFVELLPGELICESKRKKKRISPGKLGAEFEDPDEIISNGARKKSPARISLASLNPNRRVGCCPVGDPNGQVYKVGYGCCVDEIFRKETHFCCLLKKRVLENNMENKGYCYPPSGIPFCRQSDLDMESKSPMTKECEYNEYGTPTYCNFICPSGMVPTQNVTSTTCTEIGVWNQQPTCCEGCPTSLKLDLWFLIEVSQNYGIENFNFIKQFLKDSLAFMPVSQDGVRVGVTIFNRVIFYDVGVWYMNEHDSHKSLNVAIDEIPMEGTGTKTGAALNWGADNAFTDSKGGREDVENLAVVILNDQPEDLFIEPAQKLKEISDVIAIAIDNKVSDDDLGVIASSPNNTYRSSSFEYLKNMKKLLYQNICGQNCGEDNEI